jgi:hypothetical protein
MPKSTAAQLSSPNWHVRIPKSPTPHWLRQPHIFFLAHSLPRLLLLLLSMSQICLMMTPKLGIWTTKVPHFVNITYSKGRREASFHPSEDKKVCLVFEHMEFIHRPSPFLVKMLGLGPGNVANWCVYPGNSSTLEAQVLNVLHNTFRYKLENS